MTMHARRWQSRWTIVCALVLHACCIADEPPPAAEKAPEQEAGVRRALILCGLPGDKEHRALFAQSVEQLYSGLTKHQGFDTRNVLVLWPDKPTESDGPAVRSTAGVAAREAIEKTLASLREQLQPDDSFWLIVIGHTHYDGRYSWLNLPGPDIHHVDFGKLFSRVTCREQVFWITTPASGYYLEPLARPGRVVITATEADLEVNETILHQALAKLIGSPPPWKDFDADQDGVASALDLYLLVAREVAQTYRSADLLATEHAMLDDNGDGKGTEIQLDYLPQELGGRPANKPSSRKPHDDGHIAAKVLMQAGEPPTPDTAEASPDQAEKR